MRRTASMTLSILLLLASGCSSIAGTLADPIENASAEAHPSETGSTGGASPGDEGVAPTETPLPHSAIRVERARVTRVVDGDTIRAVLASGVSEKIRFIGMNTPESTTKHEPYGSQASAFTKRLLDGKTVYLQTDLDLRDRYGRLLAYVWLAPPQRADRAEISRSMVNAILIRDGYAQVATYPPNVVYVDHFLALQRQARDTRRGLWGL